MIDRDIIEILEAVCDDEELAYYVAYLGQNMKDGYVYRKWLSNRNRCPKCGSKWLKVRYANEIHTELEERPIERVVDSIVCDECGEVIE